MNRSDALPYISWVVDDAGSARKPDDVAVEILPDAVLVGWQCGFEPVFVAVQSYLPGVQIDADDAVEMATEWLTECGWFSDDPTEPDYVIA